MSAPGGGPQDDAEALRPGALILAAFPRMMGKSRPGVVVLRLDARPNAHPTPRLPPRGGAAAPRTIVATPATTQRSNQPGRLPLSAGATPGLRASSELLVPMTAALPVSRIEGTLGVVDPETLARLIAAIDGWFGAGWRRTQPPLEAGCPRPRLLHPSRRRGKPV